MAAPTPETKKSVESISGQSPPNAETPEQKAGQRMQEAYHESDQDPHAALSTLAEVEEEPTVADTEVVDQTDGVLVEDSEEREASAFQDYFESPEGQALFEDTNNVEVPVEEEAEQPQPEDAEDEEQQEPKEQSQDMPELRAAIDSGLLDEIRSGRSAKGNKILVYRRGSDYVVQRGSEGDLVCTAEEAKSLGIYDAGKEYYDSLPDSAQAETESPTAKERIPNQLQTPEHRKRVEALAVVDLLRAQSEDDGRLDRETKLGAESSIDETNRNLWLRNEIVNGLAEKVRAGVITISQGHGGFRLVGEGMPSGAGGVFTAAELREYGLDVAAEFAANNPDAEYDATAFEQKAEASFIERKPHEHAQYEKVVTGLGAYEDSIARGDLKIVETSDGGFSLQGDDAPEGVYRFEHLESAGLFAAQDARERANVYGEEDEATREARVGELRTAIGNGLIGDIRSGEQGQMVVQTHGGWKVKGFEGVYTASELRELGVMDAAKIYETRYSETQATSEVEATATDDGVGAAETTTEAEEETLETEEATSEDEAETDEDTSEAEAPEDGGEDEDEPEAEAESEDTPEQTENRAAVEQAKIDFEKMTVAEIREFIKKGEQLIALMETFKKAIEASEIEEEQKAKLLEIVGKIVEAQTALNAEAQSTLETKEAQEAQKTEIADVQSLINELMEALTFTDETLTPEQQKNQEKQQSLLSQLMAMLLQMLFTPQSSRNA